MKCNDVRAQLSLIRPDSRDADQSEFAPEMVHLEQCADCQAYWAIQQQADRELTRAMRNVAVPADLKSRLLANLSASIESSLGTASISPAGSAPAAITSASGAATTAVATSETATTVTALPTTTIQPLPRTRPADHVWTRRRAATVGSAALLLLAFGSWFFLNTPNQQQLTITNVLALVHAPDALLAPQFQQSFRPELPSSEIQTPSKGNPIAPLSLRYQGQEIGALFHYAAGRRAGGPNVVLVVINLNRVVVANLSAVGSSFVGAEVAYPPPHLYATRTWRVGQNLYVCYVQSKTPQDLERLKIHNSVS